MNTRYTFFSLLLLTVSLGVLGCERETTVEIEETPEPVAWRQHDIERPRPEVATPPNQNLPAPVPPDAVVLFGGSGLSQWETEEGGEATWSVENGYFEVAPGTGAIQTKGEYGDMQLHVEWAAPTPPPGTGQDRGNSGIFLMNRYEVQVLDSYNSETYADGQAGAIYGQYPPLFNATRPPGEWQSYDIYFKRPRFAEDSSLVSPASLTVVLNGILVQNNEDLPGQTIWLKTLPYEAHPDKAPIQLQDHGSPVRFRNIWLREIPERPEPDAAYAGRIQPIEMTTEELDRFTGVYSRARDTLSAPITITREGDYLLGDFYHRPGELTLVPISENEFALTETAGSVVFHVGTQSTPDSLTFFLGGAQYPAWRTDQPAN